MNSQQEVLITADVGGTNARIGLVETLLIENIQKNAVQHVRNFLCADYASLTDILREYMSDRPEYQFSRAVIAAAGYVKNGVVTGGNLPWQISAVGLEKELPLEHVSVLNDLEAVAHATEHLGHEDIVSLNKDSVEDKEAPIVVIGPGTGLGASILIPTRHNSIVLTAEIGQMSFAPIDDTQVEILKVLRNKKQRITNEDLLSGPGLINIHHALAVMDGFSTEELKPEDIRKKAKDDQRCRNTLEIFFSILGAVAGDLALASGASGGIYLAGGVLPRLEDDLIQSRFMQCFSDKGGMQSILKSIPVYLIKRPYIGNYGAVVWFSKNLNYSLN